VLNKVKGSVYLNRPLLYPRLGISLHRLDRDRFDQAGVGIKDTTPSDLFRLWLATLRGERETITDIISLGSGWPP
jgi:hypothetical protein